MRDRHNQELQEQVLTKDREISTHCDHLQQQQDEIGTKNDQIQQLQNTIQTLTTQMEVGRPDLFLLSISILSCLQELRTDLQRILQTKDADSDELSKCQQEKKGQVRHE